LTSGLFPVIYPALSEDTRRPWLRERVGPLWSGARSGERWLRLSRCCYGGVVGVPGGRSRSMALRISRSLRMAAVSMSFLGLPTARARRARAWPPPGVAGTATGRPLCPSLASQIASRQTEIAQDLSQKAGRDLVCQSRDRLGSSGVPVPHGTTFRSLYPRFALPRSATCPENRTQSDRHRTQIGHLCRMEFEIHRPCDDSDTSIG
jgi:hypothetical protein